MSSRSHITARRGKSLFLAALMLLFSSAPVLTTSLVSAHENHTLASWSTGGSNDTGWLRLDAVGANPETGAGAYTDLVMEFPPGAEISNVSLGIRADGAAGLAIDAPRLFSLDNNDALLDWGS